MSGLILRRSSYSNWKFLITLGREVLGEDVAYGHQVPQNGPARFIRQVQGDAQLVAVVFVEEAAPVPILAVHLVPVQRGATVDLQALAGLQANNLGAHVGEHLDRPGNCYELAHLQDSDAFEGSGHG